MEKNKLSLQLSRTALTITLLIWFHALTIYCGYTLFLLPIFFLYIVPTIFNIIIAYEKNHKKSNSLGNTFFIYWFWGDINFYVSFVSSRYNLYIIYSANYLFNTFLFNI